MITFFENFIEKTLKILLGTMHWYFQRNTFLNLWKLKCKNLWRNFRTNFWLNPWRNSFTYSCGNFLWNQGEIHEEILVKIRKYSLAEFWKKPMEIILNFFWRNFSRIFLGNILREPLQEFLKKQMEESMKRITIDFKTEFPVDVS